MIEVKQDKIDEEDFGETQTYKVGNMTYYFQGVPKEYLAQAARDLDEAIEREYERQHIEKILKNQAKESYKSRLLKLQRKINQRK